MPFSPSLPPPPRASGDCLPPSTRPVFFPQFLDPPCELTGRDGRIVRKATLKNLAYNPLWRSREESRLFRQLAWQWWNSPERPKWSQDRVARLLGVSQKTISRLARSFRADPQSWVRRFARSVPATLLKLLQARQDAEPMRRCGVFRRPVRWRRVRHTLQGKPQRQRIPTNAEMCRRAALRDSRPFHDYHYPSLSLAAAQARSIPLCASDSLRPRPTKVPGPRPFDPSLLTYDQLPLWARGLIMAPTPAAPPNLGSASFVPQTAPPGPRLVRFARPHLPRR